MKLDIQAMIKNANGDEGESESKGETPTEEQVIKFLQKHPSPKDKVFHEWAEENGFNVHKAEAIAYKIISDLVSKGRSKGQHPPGIATADVAKGVKIEEEHTSNKTIQRKITDDHNTELKHYYDPKKGLPKMEKDLEKKAFVSGLLKDAAAPNIINVDVPLFIRMLEWAHEDAKTDMQLHQATENLVGMAGKGLLTMDAYRDAVSGKNMPPLPPIMGKSAGVKIGRSEDVEKEAGKMVKCPITGKMVPEEGRGKGPGGGKGMKAGRGMGPGKGLGRALMEKKSGEFDADAVIMAGFINELDKISMSTEEVKKKISAPPTGDTGPAGKGLNDPRAIAAKKAIMEKKGEGGNVKDLLAILKKEPRKTKV